MKKILSYLLFTTSVCILFSGCCRYGCNNYYSGSPYYYSSYPVTYQYVPVSPVVHYVPMIP